MPTNILTPSKITPEDRLRDKIQRQRDFLDTFWAVSVAREKYYEAEKAKLADLERQLREMTT